MKRRGKRIMYILIGLVVGIAGILMIYFNLPGSQTKAEFATRVEEQIAEAEHREDVFREEDIAGLPAPVQKYFRACGYIGSPKMSYIKIHFKDADFSFGPDKPTLKIDYTQYNFVQGPNRIVYIDSSLYGIPFEGLDTFLDGAGTMQGRLAKLFTLFRQAGKVMDKSSLVTFLSEVPVVPSAALQDYVSWKAIDDLHAKATITCYGISAGGIFTFNEDGEVLSFETDDRSVVAADGSSEAVRWTAVFAAYKEANGVRRPSILQAVWHYADGDHVYFDGKGVITEYH